MSECKNLDELIDLLDWDHKRVARAAEFATHLTGLLTQNRFQKTRSTGFSDGGSRGVNNDLESIHIILDHSIDKLWAKLLELEKLIMGTYKEDGKE